MSKKEGQKSDSNDNNNNASKNALQTPKWCCVAMDKTGNDVTTEVGMQWVGWGQLTLVWVGDTCWGQQTLVQDVYLSSFSFESQRAEF